MKRKTLNLLIGSLLVSVAASHAEIIIKDDFDNMGGPGDSITNSVLEVGSGTWVGSFESNGGNIMRAPADPGTMEGASIALPNFNPGDIITIKARAAETDSTTAWFGMGFSDSSDVLSSLANNTPWATFTPVSGGANVFGGTSTANSSGTLTRLSGGVGAAVTLMEFIYDTGAGAVTIIYGGETVHDAVVITTSGTPTLDHAFFVMRTPEGGGPPGSYLVDFEVSVIPEPYAAWTESYSLSGLDAEMDADPDSDEMDNLVEYALGGNPTNSDAMAILPVSGLVDAESTNWLEYVYHRRLDAAARGLTYEVVRHDDLVLGAWTNSGITEAGVVVLDAEFEAVTNRIPTETEPQQFLKLNIEFE